MEYSDSNYNELADYCKTIKKSKGLTRDKERELALRIKEGDYDALDMLIESNLKYVVTIAKRFAWTGIPIYDLISEGNLGLIKAARKFDPDRGTKFITCAKPWITQSIQEYVKNQNIDKEFSHIDDYVFDGDVREEFINTDFEDDIENIRFRENNISELLKCLTKRECRVLQSYFGLNGYKEMTLNEIGIDMGLTQERVRQIKDESIEKLQFIVMGNGSYYDFRELY